MVRACSRIGVEINGNLARRVLSVGNCSCGRVLMDVYKELCISFGRRRICFSEIYRSSKGWGRAW